MHEATPHDPARCDSAKPTVPQLEADFSPELLDKMSPQELEEVADTLDVMKARRILMREAPRRYRFRRRNLERRMHPLEIAPDLITFGQADGLGRLVVDLDLQMVTVVPETWTPELRKDYRAEVPANEAAERSSLDLSVRLWASSWFGRKLPLLERMYLDGTRQQQDGSWLVCDLAPSILEMLRQDVVSFEEHELARACGSTAMSAWAEALAASVTHEMQRRQQEAFRAHPDFAEGLALAEEALGSTNTVAAALATLRLERWARKLDSTAFAEFASAEALARDLAGQLLDM